MHYRLRSSRLPLAGVIVAALALTACAGPTTGGKPAATGSTQAANWGKSSGTVEFWDTAARDDIERDNGALGASLVGHTHDDSPPERPNASSQRK